MIPSENRWLARAGFFLLLLGGTFANPGQIAAQNNNDAQRVNRLLREMLIQQYGYGDVVVATVTKVSRHKATNSNPPLLELKVHEVLRGARKPDRLPAIWKPPMGPLCGNDPQLGQWLAAPLAGPAVGEKWILWGDQEDVKGVKRFAVRASARFPFTAEKEKEVKKILQEAEQAVCEYYDEQETAVNQLREARARWREQVSDKDIARAVAQADFVGVGKRISDSGPTYQFTQILKGEKRTKYTDGSYYVEVEFAKKVEELLDRETTYLIFLTEKVVHPGHRGVIYRPVAFGDGILIADRAGLEAARKALKEKTDGPRPR